MKIFKTFKFWKISGIVLSALLAITKVMCVITGKTDCVGKSMYQKQNMEFADFLTESLITKIMSLFKGGQK